MARIRTIKPEFFTSEDIVELTPLSRLFYVSLWCESDREGRLIWKPKTFKLRYFPGDNCDIESMGKELIEAGLIEIYEINGKQYAEIPSFKSHQVINNRESESILPEKYDASPTRESGVKAEGKEGRKGKEGKGTSRVNEFSIPEWLDKSLWDDFLSNRKKLKAINSERALNTLVNKLTKFKTDGLDPNKILETAVVKSWKDVYLTDEQKNKPSQRPGEFPRV